MNVFELYATLGLDSTQYDEGLTKAAATGSAVGTIIGNVATKGFTALTDSMQESYKQGVEFQESMAKTSTIADLSQVSFDELQNQILEVSGAFNVAASDVAESTYGIISATGDTEHATELAAQAAKLAAAGFTTADAAASVLTSSMNSYGYSAEQAAGIADLLLTVQNLGVTTVDELASSYGRAEATASAYNIGLGEVGASTVALTKAGISTNEAVTYMSSMWKELGDTGSDVSKILQEKTGHTLGELEEQGYSCADMLGVLMDSVDGNSEAFMNLWGSAEAGKSANAIVNQGIETYNSNLQEMQTQLENTDSSIGATAEAYETMSDTLSYKTDSIKNSISNGLIAIFEKAEPAIEKVVDKVTDFVQNVDIEKIADDIGTLKDKLEPLIPVLAGIAAGFVAFQTITTISSVIGTVTPVITALGTALSMASSPLALLTGAFTAISSPALIAAAAIAGIVAVIVYLWNTNEEFRNVVIALWDEISAKFVEAWHTIKTAWDEAAPYFAKVWESIKTIFSVVGDVLGSFFISALDTIKLVWDTATGYFSAIWETIKGIFAVVEAVFRGDFQGAWNAIKGIVDTWAGYFGQVWQDIKNVFSDAIDLGKSIVNGIKDGISAAWEGITSMVQGLWNGLKSIFTIDSSDVKTSGTSARGHAGGLDYVPYDEYPAYLHRGEMVLTAREAAGYRSGNSGSDNAAVIAAIQSLERTLREKNMTAAISSKAIFNAVVDENSRYTTRTGASAF